MAGGEAGTPEELGVKLTSITLRNQATSKASLSRIAEFDEVTDIFTYGTSVTIQRCRVNRDSSGSVTSLISRTIFKGKIITNPRNASPVQEGQEIEILDVWDELERTIYQETWAIGPGPSEVPRDPVYMPRAILGINPSGGNITTADQLGLFLQYAKNQAGVGLLIGSCPGGLSLWPSEVNNMTVAELIRNTMKYHPNWVSQINYETSPVTINFIDPNLANDLSYALDGSGDVAGFSVREVSERVPECVAITYETTSRLDDETYRDVVQDIFPGGGNPLAPGSLSVTVNLEGANVVTMKQAIETANMPAAVGDVRAWIKLKFPSLAEVPDEHYTIRDYQRILIPDGPQPEEPVNEDEPRLEVLAFDELPRELIRGTIADWMRRKARKVEVNFGLYPTLIAEIAAEDDEALAALLAKLPQGENKLVVTCTNATTKTYKGTSSYTPAENAPTGIAQAVYNSLAQSQYEGFVSLTYDEIPDTIFTGKKINLTEGRAEWASMAAMVTEVKYDIAPSQVTISFGPPPYLSPGDWVELQRALRGRQPTWITNRETDEPSDGGAEISGPYDTPNTESIKPCASIKTLLGIRGITIDKEESEVTVGMPDAYHGNVMYFNRPFPEDPDLPGEWVPLDNPAAPEVSEMINVLKHPGGDDTIPEWVEIQPLPEGAEGDILYHDGTKWVVLNRPVTSATHLLGIQGGVPLWIETDECSS